MFFDEVKLVQDLVPAAIFGSVASYVVLEHILSPLLLNPLVLCFVKKESEENEKNDSEHQKSIQKIEWGVTKITFNCIMFFCWVYYFAICFSGWEDVMEWKIYLQPLKIDHVEFKTASFLYFTYLVYIFLGFLKNYHKNRNKDQMLLDLHDATVVVCSVVSLKWGLWRGGFILCTLATFGDIFSNISFVVNEITCIKNGRIKGFPSTYYCFTAFFGSCIVARVMGFSLVFYAIAQVAVGNPGKWEQTHALNAVYGCTFGCFIFLALQIKWTCKLWNVWQVHREAFLKNRLQGTEKENFVGQNKSYKTSGTNDYEFKFDFPTE